MGNFFLYFWTSGKLIKDNARRSKGQKEGKHNTCGQCTKVLQKMDADKPNPFTKRSSAHLLMPGHKGRHLVDVNAIERVKDGERLHGAERVQHVRVVAHVAAKTAWKFGGGVCAKVEGMGSECVEKDTQWKSQRNTMFNVPLYHQNVTNKSSLAHTQS